MLPDIERKGAFGVRDLRSRDRSLVLGSLQAPLTLAPALKQVAEAEIKLLVLIDVFRRKVLRAKDRDELRVDAQVRVGSQVGRDLLGLILEDQGTRRLQRMVVAQSQIDRLVEADECGALPSSFSMKRPSSEGLFRPYTPKSVFDLGPPRLTSVRRSWGMLSLGNSAVTAVSACIVLSFFEGSESVAAKYGPTARCGVQDFTASPWWRSASLNSDTGIARLS